MKLVTSSFLATAALLTAASCVQGGEMRIGDSVKMRDYEFPIVAVVDGYPVYMIGDVAVYGVSPYVVPDAAMQEGNAGPAEKIVPKKSYEISSNYIGLNPSRLPNSAKSEELPFVSSHLIDGNYETSWLDRGARGPDLERPWVRIDLAKPTVIDRINLVPPQYFPEYNRASPPNLWAWPGALPEHYEIEATADGRQWETVQDVKDQAAPDGQQIISFEMPEKPVLQVRITGKRMRQVLSGFAFGLAEVELIDRAGRNVALVSNGGMAFVSSTNYGYANRRQTRSDLWPLMYDIGAKWLRTGYWNDATCWHFVERKPDVLKLDPVTKNALIEATDYGITISQGLYSMPFFRGGSLKDTQYANGFISYNALYNWPTSPEQLGAWRKYVRFMVNELKGHVRYWEVWNEAFDVSGGLGSMGHIDPYVAMLKVASEEIRKADPQNKVIFAEVVPLSSAALGVVDALLEKGAGQYGDAIAWHPYQGVRPEIVDPNFKRVLPSKYPEVNATEQMWGKLREIAKKHDFDGRYFANEYFWTAAPPSNELTKAKYAVRNAVLHAAHDIAFFWCEIWHNYNPKTDAGLLRVGPSMEPDTPQTPAPVYYALRTICTVMDGAKPDPGIKVTASNTEDPLEIHGFRLDDGDSLIALWRPIDADDTCPAVKTDVVVAGARPKRMLLIDTLNGAQQEASFSQEGGGARIGALLVRDYPMFLKLVR